MLAVVNEEQQQEILDMLSDFEVKYLGENLKEYNEDYFKYPLLIDFKEKTIRRITSITCLAPASKNILRDYTMAKSIIEEYLQEKATSKTF